MKKIVYAITKIGKKENTKISGIGFITDEDILTACDGAKGKPYIRVFENAVKACHQDINKKDEFKGAYTEIVEMQLTDDKERKTLREVEINYLIWYKLVD